MAEIGVMVPVYKAEKYLDRCVLSILNQTYTDFRLVLVDDESPDGSGAICDSYAAEDSRIHVIHMPHGGLSAARNEGARYLLEQTDCQWIVFIDSDDWVHPEMLERLLQAAKDCDVNVSIAGYGETMDDTAPWGEEIAQPELWTPEDFYLRHFINATIAVAKLYRRESFLGKKYPEGRIHEDEYVTYRILFEQSRLAVILSPLYAYYHNPESITKRSWTPSHLDAWDAYEQQIRFFADRGNEEMVRYRYRAYLENALVNLQSAEAENVYGKYTKTIRFIKRRIRRVIPRAWKAGTIHFWRDYDMLCRFYPYLSRCYRLYREVYYEGKWRKKHENN